MSTHQLAQATSANASFTPVRSGLLQRKCACGNHTIAGGECEECRKKKRLGLQTELKVNEPGDIYEQEADRVAGQVTSMPANHAVGGAPPRIQRVSATIHICSSKTKTPGIDAKSCGTKVTDTQITITGWLNSIVQQKKDALSPPPRGGSESMGKFDVQSKGNEKDLVVFETRGETKRKRSQAADKWMDYADEVFRMAAVCRKRPGTGTELIYDGKNSFDPKTCP